MIGVIIAMIMFLLSTLQRIDLPQKRRYLGSGGYSKIDVCIGGDREKIRDHWLVRWGEQFQKYLPTIDTWVGIIECGSIRTD